MPRYVLTLNPGRYFVWSTVVDGPLEHEMSREQMIDHLVRHEYSQVDRDLAEEQARRDLTRVDTHGTSSPDPTDTAERMVTFNRMGPRGGRVRVDKVRKMIASEG